MKSAISVDVEADGPCPGIYNMVSFGAVVIDQSNLRHRYYSEVMRPLSDKWIPEALEVSGVSRDQQLAGRDPTEVMYEFRDWLHNLNSNRLMFYSDNNGFDWQFINYYFWYCCNENPFGWSSTNISSLYKGIVKDRRKSFSHLRKTKHTHHPLDDALGNAEAMQTMIRRGLK